MKFATAPVALGLALAATAGLATPAYAGNPEGKLQVKVLGTAVLPSGKITRVDTDLVGLPAGTQTEANDNVVPTVAIEYFFSKNISLETICCITQHDVDGTTGLPGAELVSDARIIPATFTLKYHLDTGSGFKPYVGAGPTFFLIFDEDPGAFAVGLGSDDLDMSSELGFALQAGADFALSDSGFGLSIDAKKYFVDTKAKWYAGGVEVIGTKHKLDPWVLSAGVSYRF